MTKTFEIYFHNLNEETKKEFLEFQGVDSPEECNADLAPLAMIDLEINDNPEEVA